MPSRSLLVALVLACVVLMIVDRAGAENSPVAPVRRVVGEVLGPAQAGVSKLLEPFVAIPGWLHTNASLRDRIGDLQADNRQLRADQHTAAYHAHRLAGLADLCAMATNTGYLLAPARVVGYGSAQDFSSTVTIDAGTDAGLRPDLTVLDGDGLVGRVLDVTSHTATVLLIVDTDSHVGAKVGATLENGFVDGKGGLAHSDPLELRLLDDTVLPQKGASVVTWGSESGRPYVAGIPIGEVTKVYQDLRAGTYRAVLRPYADFTSLTDVGVVVPSGGDHRVIEPGGCR
jgi:rod shape-determining protein MreC